VFDKPTVLIYRNHLLMPSETFVRDQADALQSFSPFYLGLRRVPGISISEENSIVVNHGKIIGKLNEVRSLALGFPNNYLQQIRILNPKLIHAHFGQDGAIALSLANQLDIPIIVTIHGYDITVNDGFAEPSLIQKLYVQRKNKLKQTASLFIAVSTFIKDKLIDQGFSSEKIIVHYIGVDTKKFQPNPTVCRSSTVLFVGRLVEKKGCEYLIKAMARVQTSMPEVELVIAGYGPLQASLEQMAQRCLKRYRFLGVQSPEQVRQWMQNATVFCVPSITACSGDSEGFGLVFTEAQAMGLPVVSFASGGMPEAVAHDETGFLVPERDSEGLAFHITRLLVDHELWQSFSQRGQKRVHTHFDLHSQTRILEKIYSEKVLNYAN
jgi:colanic acid/amylovoran biosynthesis glycosyltransferase